METTKTDVLDPIKYLQTIKLCREEPSEGYNNLYIESLNVIS